MKLEGMIELEDFSKGRSEMIGVTETARILKVSVNTVRRLADSGKLPCVKVKDTNYRRFYKKNVISFRKSFYSNDENNGMDILTGITIDSPRPNINNIRAKSHPAHYLMHKYWGRKPHNVVADYISNYTNTGDMVLDPFMGSGIVPIEAIKQGRCAIGVDINPMSKFIAENSITPIDIECYSQECNRILKELAIEWEYLYFTKCPDCGRKAQIETAVWDNGQISRIKGKCILDGVFRKDADTEDIKVVQQISKMREKFDDEKTIFYPMDKVLKYVKRSGKDSIDELFTDRALIILSKLRESILKVDNEEMKNLLLFTFTSMLANVSNMLPGDLETATYKSGWVISKFWVPKIHTERNIFHCFKLRSAAIAKGKRELSAIDDKLVSFYNADSNHLEFIEDQSVDYIFTDPPYGESIAYLALSQFWNSWLEKTVDYDNEIIVDSYRSKGYIDYSSRMLASFKEMYRVLKDKHYLSFTFHNRDLNVWKGVMEAVKTAGFILHTVTLQEQAVSSGTQGINKTNTLTGDFVYTFYKDTVDKGCVKSSNSSSKSREYVEKMIKKLIEDNNGITPSKLYEYLIPQIIHSGSYLDEKGNALDIEKILGDKYEYIEVTSERKIGEKYQWQLKK